MAGTQIELKAVARKTGKHNSRSLRVNKMIPAVCYGPKTKNINFSVTENDVIKYSSAKFDNEIFKLKSDDKDIDGLLVLKKDISIHPVSRRPVHLDFLVPDMTQTVKVDVEIKYEGTSIGVKEGGIFNILMRSIEVECLPIEIPEAFIVDITNLGLNENFHVSDIELGSDKVTLISSPDDTIATVSQAKEEAAADPAAAAEGDAAAPAAAATPAADDKK